MGSVRNGWFRSRGISRDIRLMNLIQCDQACGDLDVRVDHRRRRRCVKISWLGYLSCDRSFHAREIYQEFEAWILFWKDWRIVRWKMACAYGPCIFALIKSRENTFDLFFFSSFFFFFFSFLVFSSREFSREITEKRCSWLKFCETVVFSSVSRVKINRFDGNV